VQVRKAGAEASVKAAAEANAARSAQALSKRIGRLLEAQLTFSGLASKINAAGVILTSDFSQASASSQRRHDDQSVFSEPEEAQNELGYVKKAQTVEGEMESLEIQDCEQWQTIYGIGVARQLCSDFASTNEPRENELMEWLRAIDEIIDNLNAVKAFQAYPYSSVMIHKWHDTGESSP
jgi:hypothetical protein